MVVGQLAGHWRKNTHVSSLLTPKWIPVGQKVKKSKIVKVIKEDIAIFKNNIGVGKAKARYITQKPQRLRAMTTLKFQNHKQ